MHTEEIRRPKIRKRPRPNPRLTKSVSEIAKNHQTDLFVFPRPRHADKRQGPGSFSPFSVILLPAVNLLSRHVQAALVRFLGSENTCLPDVLQHFFNQVLFLFSIPRSNLISTAFSACSLRLSDYFHLFLILLCSFLDDDDA